MITSSLIKRIGTYILVLVVMGILFILSANFVQQKEAKAEQPASILSVLVGGKSVSKRKNEQEFNAKLSVYRDAISEDSTVFDDDPDTIYAKQKKDGTQKKTEEKVEVSGPPSGLESSTKVEESDISQSTTSSTKAINKPIIPESSSSNDQPKVSSESEGSTESKENTTNVNTDIFNLLN